VIGRVWGIEFFFLIKFYNFKKYKLLSHAIIATWGCSYKMNLSYYYYYFDKIMIVYLNFLIVNLFMVYNYIHYFFE